MITVAYCADPTLEENSWPISCGVFIRGQVGDVHRGNLETVTFGEIDLVAIEEM